MPGDALEASRRDLPRKNRGFRLPVVRRNPLGTSPFVLLTLGAGLMAAPASFLILGQIQSTVHPSHTIWFWVAMALLAVGTATFIAGIVEGVRQYRESRYTPLVIEHDPDDLQCLQRRGGTFADIELRIKVHNTGRFDLNRVRAHLRVQGGHEHWLRVRHDNTAPFHRSLEGEALPADSSYWLYFDVAYAGLGKGWDGYVAFEYADDYLKQNSMWNDLIREITIKVWASRESDDRSVIPAEKRFSIARRDDEHGPMMNLTET
jgi:hypothetical protein